MVSFFGGTSTLQSHPRLPSPPPQCVNSQASTPKLLSTIVPQAQGPSPIFSATGYTFSLLTHFISPSYPPHHISVTYHALMISRDISISCYLDRLPCQCLLPLACTCEYVYTHILTRTCTHTYAHIHTHMHTYMYTHICTHTHTHTHKHKHTHTHTHTHTQVHPGQGQCHKMHGVSSEAISNGLMQWNHLPSRAWSTT